MNKKGYVHIYTGNGKGKTTSAMGLVLRTLGHGKRVYIGQFMKGRLTGELKALKKFGSQVKAEQFGSKKFSISSRQPISSEVKMAQEGLSKTQKAVASGKFDLVLLDEIIVAIKFNLIQEIQVVDLMDCSPKGMELVLTGRGASRNLIKRADLVSEIKETKHYFNKGVPARKGIEF